MFDIVVYKNFHNQMLKQSWQNIYYQGDYCPQSSYEWNYYWWKYFGKGKKRSLNIIALKDTGNIVAVAPFMIERIFPVPVAQLKFVGSGLTDFHEILISEQVDKEKVLSDLFAFIFKTVNVDLINLEQISDNTYFYLFLNQSHWAYDNLSRISPGTENQTFALVCKEPFTDNGGFRKRLMIRCPVVNFDSMTWDGYLLKLSGNQRRKYKKKLRRLERQGYLDFQVIESFREVKSQLDDLLNLHVIRWNVAGGDSKFGKASVRKFLFDVVAGAADIRAYVLRLNNKVIAYRLGFIRKKVFYDWNTSFDPEFRYFSPGLVLTGLAIKDLVENKFGKFNFMRGNYDYKRMWMTDDETIFNYQFLCPVTSLSGGLSCKYYLHWKWSLKNIMTKFTGKYRCVCGKSGNRSIRVLF